MLIGIEELKQAARSLMNNTAPGPDGIPKEVRKRFAVNQPDALVDIYNRCFYEGCISSISKAWKRLVLLQKGNKPLDNPSSYRPLCLLE